MGSLAQQIIVTCEHASNRLPPELHLDPALLQLHIAWDLGARRIARGLARHFGASLFEGEYSRLVVDLNRTVTNRMLIRRVSDGHEIPFNRGLDAAARQRRIDTYYRPYREAVEAAVHGTIARHGRCVHLCVHTFTPALAGRARPNDIGLLHDPSWGIERPVCAEIRDWLQRATDYRVWFNRPYSGTADGILPALRRRTTPQTFVGLELEVNQRHAAQPRQLDRVARALALAVSQARALAG